MSQSPSRSPVRGGSRSRSPTPRSAKRSKTGTRSPSPARRSISPRSRTRSITPASADGSRPRQGRGRSYSRSISRSPDQGGRRYRSRSYSESRSRSRSLSPPQSTKIVVEKLTKNVNEEHLKEIFSVYGSIREIDMPINRQFNTNRGTVYITYDTTTHAETAISHMHEAQLDGTVIKVSIVLPRRRFSRSPPPAKRPGANNYDRFDARGPPPSGYRGGPPPGPPPSRGPGGGGRYRSPPRWERGAGGGGGYDRPGPRGGRDFDTYRPRSYSRSRSPVSPRRSYTRSLSSRSRSPPPRRRRSPPRDDRRRRSPSYSSYSSESRSRSRTRGGRTRGRY